MLRHRGHRKPFLAVMWTVLAVSVNSAYAQSSEPGRSETGVAVEEPRPSDLKSEVDTLKAENAVVRELLRKMEEQQQALLAQVDRLQRRLDGVATAVVQPAAPSPVDDGGGALATTAAAPVPDTNAGNRPEPQASVAKEAKEDRYQDGIVIWKNADDAEVPFLLKFNNNTQIRYLNTLDSSSTFTDHLGNVRDVHRRNDITVNRSMFILGGYMFDKRLRYSFTVWTSAGAASIVVASNIGWQFNKGLAITAGYTGVPGSRSLVNSFPFFASTDRTMADNFFRPAFTQGVWANGEIRKGLHYLAFVGNGLNTLSISANKIDTSLLTSGSVWWEPLGDYSEPGKSRNMYDDFFAQKKVRVRTSRIPITSRCTTPTGC